MHCFCIGAPKARVKKQHLEEKQLLYDLAAKLFLFWSLFLPEMAAASQDQLLVAIVAWDETQ